MNTQTFFIKAVENYALILHYTQECQFAEVQAG